MGGPVCGVCGWTYAELRTGHTYREVRAMLWVNSPDPADWRYKRRGTVLGLWRSIKLTLWQQHLTECAYHARSQSA
jgi:hypothetical protein